MQRSQDYLVNSPGQDQNQDTQRSYRLAGGPSVSFSGGQVRSAQAFQGAQSNVPDRARQSFRTRERQIRENRPIDFTLKGTESAKQNIQSDIVGQGLEQERRLAEGAPKLDEFLPDYSKALGGDQGALQRTGERLQGSYKAKEVAPIQATEGQAFLDFLREPSQEAFHTELTKQRGGTFGVNALDAAILQASGKGSDAFTQAKRDIGQVYNLIPQTEQRLRGIEQNREKRYGDLVSQIKGQLTTDEKGMHADAQKEMAGYRGRDFNAILQQISNEIAQKNPELKGFLNNINPNVYEPFIDRDLSFEETLDPREVTRYNAIAELLGTSPVQAVSRGQEFNRDKIVNAMLGEAQNNLANFKKRDTYEGRGELARQKLTPEQQSLFNDLAPDQKELAARAILGMPPDSAASGGQSVRMAPTNPKDYARLLRTLSATPSQWTKGPDGKWQKVRFQNGVRLSTTSEKGYL